MPRAAVWSTRLRCVRLESGQVAAAGFDVFMTEPARDSALFGAPNFVATPHLGASTNEAQENVAIQIAAQMSDFLLAGTVTNALNMASISAEEAPRLGPFIRLIEKLGSFAGQLADEGIEGIEIEYEGDVAQLNTQPLTAVALAAVMRPLIPDVNVVSAPAVLKQRGTLRIPAMVNALSCPVHSKIIMLKGRDSAKRFIFKYSTDGPSGANTSISTRS